MKRTWKSENGSLSSTHNPDDTWMSSSLQVRVAAARSRNVQVVHSTGFLLRFEGDEGERFELPALSGNVYRQRLTENELRDFSRLWHPGCVQQSGEHNM